MYLTRLLSLSSTGTILIASQIPWFFNSSLKPQINLAVEEILLEREDAPAIESVHTLVPAPQHLSPITPPADSPKTIPQTQPPAPNLQAAKITPKAKITYEDINKYEADGFIARTDKKQVKGKYSTKRLDGKTIALHLSEKSDDFVYLSSGLFTNGEEKERDFSLKVFQGYENKYAAITKEQIRISLFTNPAWNTAAKKQDEYANHLEQKQIDELFTLGPEENKLKQLLLSLTSKRLWKSNGTYRNKPNFSSYNRGWTRPSRIDELKKLEISYFSTFEELRDYISKKAKVCTGVKKACIADIKELDTFDYDEIGFHEGAYTPKKS